MKKLKMLLTAFVIGALLMGSVGFQVLTENDSKEKAVTTAEEKIPTQDPDPIKS